MYIHNIYALPIINVFAIMVLLLICWSVISIAVEHYENKTILLTLRIINGIISLAFLVVVLRYTVFGRTSDNDISIGFVRTIEQIKEQPELAREMVMNAFLFFPIGLTLPYAIASQRANKIVSPMIITILISFFLTCLLELIQGIFGIGNAELSDIIMNTVGAAIGTSSFCVKSLLLNKFKKRKD